MPAGLKHELARARTAPARVEEARGSLAHATHRTFVALALLTMGLAAALRRDSSSSSRRPPSPCSSADAALKAGQGQVRTRHAAGRVRRHTEQRRRERRVQGRSRRAGGKGRRAGRRQEPQGTRTSSTISWCCRTQRLARKVWRRHGHGRARPRPAVPGGRAGHRSADGLRRQAAQAPGQLVLRADGQRSTISASSRRHRSTLMSREGVDDGAARRN